MDSYYSNKMSYGEFFGSVMKWMAMALGITTITSFLFSFLHLELILGCLLYTSPSPRDATLSRMPSSA